MKREITIGNKSIYIEEKINPRGKSRDYVYLRDEDGDTELARVNTGAWIETMTITNPSGSSTTEPVIKYHDDDGVLLSRFFYYLFV